jgi:predicted NBD/HSP70 family sugar kinase
MQVTQVVQAFESLGNSSRERTGMSCFVPEQLRRFTKETLRARPVRPFDVQEVLRRIHLCEGMTVLAVDIGGDKITAADFSVLHGRVELSNHVLTVQGDNGVGYLAALREVADSAQRRGIPVGISFAGPISGTRLNAAPNMPFFAKELQAGYGGDFANLFWKLELANDAEAGIMAATLEAARRYPDSSGVIYLINGSGLGGAVLTDATIYAAEPGHIEVAAQFNDFDGFAQRKQCGLDGATYVCIEAVAASKAGVEDIWHQLTGKRLTGRQISLRFLDGDELARSVYLNSARITAHAIRGMGAAFGLFQKGGQPVVIGHGGIFEVPGYGALVGEILGRDLAAAARILFTKDFSGNTCLEGAAIAVMAGYA